MSVNKNNSTKDIKKENDNDSQNESPLIILKIENNNLNSELKKINNLITTLKQENLKKEQEKNLLILNNKKLENNLEDVKKELEEYNNQLIELKHKEKILLKDDINKESLDNKKLILEMQNKITDLELKLKISEKKIFEPLEQEKNSNFEIKKENSKNEEDVVVIELKKEKITNQHLLGKIKEKKKYFENISKEKNQMLNQMNECNINRKKLEILLGKKVEDIKLRNNKENKLKKDLIIQTNQNHEMTKNINIIQTKCNYLIKEKYNLEEIVIRQEDRINDLSKSMNEIKQVLNLKENEINKGKIYINNLKGIIKDLKNGYNPKGINRTNKNKQNKGFINLKIYQNTVKNREYNIINFNNFNNFKNRNNNSINNLFKININKNKKYNYKINLRRRNNKNNTPLKRIDSKNKIYFFNNSLKHYEINANKKNKSLPIVEQSSKISKDIQINGIKNTNNKLIINTKQYNYIFKEPKSKNDENKIDLKQRYKKKHLDFFKEEESDKEKINVIKGLFDKIIYHFEQ